MTGTLAALGFVKGHTAMSSQGNERCQLWSTCSGQVCHKHRVILRLAAEHCSITISMADQ